MVLECFKWIPHLLCSLISCVIGDNKGFGPFPDDILIDILSRLPADSILQCRKVCKHWRELTTSTYYVALQHKRAPTVILVQCHHNSSQNYPAEKLYFYVFEKNGRKLKKTRLKFDQHTMKEYYNVKLVGSSGGLLLFWTRFSDTIALNLITKEERLLTRFGYVCGLFFHPLASEYKYLWVRDRINCYEYYSYSSFGGKRKIASTNFRPAYETSPAIVNLALHWVVAPSTVEIKVINPCKHAVMVFRMEYEDLFTLPHPGTTNCTSSRDHGMMHLFVNDERLCLGQVRAQHGDIDIWILEDYANWNWVRRHNIVFHGSAKDVPLRYYFSDLDHCCHKIKILSVEKDEVLIDWFSCGLYLVDLTRRITRKIDVPHSKLTNYICVAYTSSIATPSLVSPNHKYHSS